MKRCPLCNSKLEHETYYDDVNDDTSYFNYCEKCGWDDYPDYLHDVITNE